MGIRHQSPVLASRRFAGVGLLLLALGSVSARGDQDLRRLRVMELETQLAKQSDLYLYFDPPANRLAIKVRGLEIAAVEILESSQLVFRPLAGEASAPPLPAPAIWTVTEDAGDTDRETIAPTTLRPYSEDEEREEPATTGKKKSDAEEVEERGQYRVQLDIGWQLMVVDESPRLDWGRRMIAAIRDGYQRLRGVETSHPPLVTLVVSSADASLLRHLFRAGTQILVAPIE